jgi:hypothetical protein
LYKIIAVVLIALTCSTAHAQLTIAERQQRFRYKIQKSNTPIKVDGVADEAAWKNAQVLQKLYMKFPTADTLAEVDVAIKITYTDKSIFICADIYDSLPLINQSLKRDARIRDNDGIGIVIDPFNKTLNGNYFSVTSANVQADDVISTNTNGDLTFSWDNKWYSQVKTYTDHYTIEIGLPFNMFRYNINDKEWGINFIHSQRKKNEFHTWTQMPINFRAFDIGFLGAIEWDAPLPKSKSNIIAIPFTTGGINQNKVPTQSTKANIDAGLDAKVALSSALNLDVTLNPDFSQIEVDRQVTNISRFNIFLPERRTFFLENNDLFSEYGNPTVRPFYSRTIGLDRNGQALPIIGGLRLSGNVAQRTRIGVMNMQTAANSTNNAQNYTSVNMQQQVLQRSSIKAYFLNRENFATTAKPITNPLDQYGRNAGTEFAYKKVDGSVEAWASFNTSIKEGIKTQNNYSTGGFGMFKPNFEFVINYDDVGKNYYTDMGYTQLLENRDDARDTVIRLGYRNYFNYFEYNIFPKKSKFINQLQFSSETQFLYYKEGGLNERANDVGAEIRLKNTGNINASIGNTQTRLLFPTAFTDATPLPAGTYNYRDVSLEYVSDTRKNFAFSAGALYGTYFGAKYMQLSGSIIVRKQPWFTLELNAEYNDLKFAAPYGTNQLLLIAPRIEINFSNNLFWTTFLQYNTQSNNFNINSRMQWRYRPASDLFLVYTDNYFADPLLKNKNRALVFKLNKWFNL